MFANILKGDFVGHPFRGNQHTGGRLGGVSNSAFTELDRKIVNYNPNKPLDAKGGADLERISDKIKGARFIPYSKTPFFEKLSALQGAHPAEVDARTHKDARAAFFATQPVETVPTKGMIFTQNVVNLKGVARSSANPNSQPAQVVKYNGKYYLMDGHHRTVRDIEAGSTSIKAHVAHIN